MANEETLWRQDFLTRSPFFTPLNVMMDEAWSKSTSWPTLSEYNQRLEALKKPINTYSGQPIRFIPQRKKAMVFEEGYEALIYKTGQIQTRENNWHDFFNMLVWLTFPKSKSIINFRHYKEKKQRLPVTVQRSSVEDALTHFDENGVVVLSSDPGLSELLKEHAWKALFMGQREKVKQKMKFFVFGHGLYEKLLTPYIGITGKGMILHVENDFFKGGLNGQLMEVDCKLSDQLSTETKFNSPKEFVAVPLLGIPGFWPENEKEDFYNNAHYFR